jgi:hypothetical protein
MKLRQTIRSSWFFQWIALLSAFCIIDGCSIAGTVIDISGSETQVSNMRLSGPGTLQVISTGTVKMIPLESLETVTLFPDEARTINGEFCFLADIVMHDGAHYTARDKNHDNIPRTFVSVNQLLFGASNKGSFSADLTGVSKISILH